MGQKLVYIQFEAGSSTSLWNPRYNPTFALEKLEYGEGNIPVWRQVTEYFPGLADSLTQPVDFQNKQQLTSQVLRKLIQRNQKVAFLADDSEGRWRVRFQDQFLTGGQVQTLKSGTFGYEELLVDMGLPSGTKWAACDINITKPSGFCDTPFTYDKSFFSWGNIDGHNPKNNSFAGVYDWGSVNAAEPYYEGQPYGTTRGSTLTGNIPVGEEFDAAQAILGAPWRIPTGGASGEYQELFSVCKYIDAGGTEIVGTNKLTTVGGTVGIYLESNRTHNRLFFACSGLGNGLNWVSPGTIGRYHSNYCNSSSSRNAGALVFYAGGVAPQNIASARYFGLPIRAVFNPRESL